MLSEEDRGKHVLTSVLGMAHNDLSENDRIVAVQVIFWSDPNKFY